MSFGVHQKYVCWILSNQGLRLINAYWFMYFGLDPSKIYKVSNLFKQDSSDGFVNRIGLLVTVVIVSSVLYWVLQSAIFQGLFFSFFFFWVCFLFWLIVNGLGCDFVCIFYWFDFVTGLILGHGIKLIFTLVNNYESFGGKKHYKNWAKSQGQYLTFNDDFFGSSLFRGQSTTIMYLLVFVFFRSFVCFLALGIPKLYFNLVTFKKYITWSLMVTINQGSNGLLLTKCRRLGSWQRSPSRCQLRGRGSSLASYGIVLHDFKFQPLKLRDKFSFFSSFQ